MGWRKRRPATVEDVWEVLRQAGVAEARVEEIEVISREKPSRPPRSSPPPVDWEAVRSEWLDLDGEPFRPDPSWRNSGDEREIAYRWAMRPHGTTPHPEQDAP